MSLATKSALKKVSVHSRATFVKKSVLTIPLTEQVIERIMPYFPFDCTVISGYLDEGQQYWKVNYHWENLVAHIEKFRALDDDAASPKLKTMAYAVWKVLMSNPPLPERGYLADRTVGATEDKSPRDRIKARYRVLKQSKRDFRDILYAAGIIERKFASGNPPAEQKPWWLAVADLAPPGTSKHGTGYALDIKGDNDEIRRICDGLGATLSFNEASHVHVEFADGVKAPMSF